MFASVVTAFAPAWQPLAAGPLLLLAATAVASVFPPELSQGGTPAQEPAAQRPERLKKRAQFLAVRRGEKRRGRLFLLEVLDRKDADPPRVGLTVTKKVGNAVVRNRVRRRLKEAARVHAAGDMTPGKDYVIVGRREVLGASFEDLAGELSRRIRGAR